MSTQQDDAVMGAIQREYNAHLATLAERRAGLSGSDALAGHDRAATEFALRAGQVLARAAANPHPVEQQQLYEELATLTQNTEALRRIEDARQKREESVRAAHRPQNRRKVRERGVQWAAGDMHCPDCQVALIFLPRLSENVCPECGKTSANCGDDSYENLPFGDRPHPVSESSYSRQTHMAELLAQVQGTERTEVPPEVVEAMRDRLRKHRLLDDPTKLTPNTVRSHLRQLKLSKWYDNAMQLALILSNGRCPRLRLPHALVQDIHASFAAAQEPFAQAIRNSKRTNFLAYSECLRTTLHAVTPNRSSSSTSHSSYTHRSVPVFQPAVTALSASTKYLCLPSCVIRNAWICIALFSSKKIRPR